MEADSDLYVNVFYHSPCLDGLYACLAAFLYYRKLTEIRLRFYPYRTDQTFQGGVERAKKTVFLDCITTEIVFKEAVDVSETVMVIDHHDGVLEQVRSWSEV
jgi:hypothetical protein